MVIAITICRINASAQLQVKSWALPQHDYLNFTAGPVLHANGLNVINPGTDANVHFNSMHKANGDLWFYLQDLISGNPTDIVVKSNGSNIDFSNTASQYFMQNSEVAIIPFYNDPTHFFLVSAGYYAIFDACSTIGSLSSVQMTPFPSVINPFGPGSLAYTNNIAITKNLNGQNGPHRFIYLSDGISIYVFEMTISNTINYISKFNFGVDNQSQGASQFITREMEVVLNDYGDLLLAVAYSRWNWPAPDDLDAIYIAKMNVNTGLMSNVVDDNFLKGWDPTIVGDPTCKGLEFSPSGRFLYVSFYLSGGGSYNHHLFRMDLDYGGGGQGVLNPEYADINYPNNVDFQYSMIERGSDNGLFINCGNKLIEINYPDEPDPGLLTFGSIQFASQQMCFSQNGLGDYRNWVYCLPDQIDGENYDQFVGNTQSLLSLTANPLNCNGGPVQLDAGPGFQTYIWEGGSITGATSQTVLATTSGTYTVTVTYACTETATASVTVSISTPISIITSHQDVSCYNGNNGSATASVSGGTAPYNIVWNPGGQTTLTASNLPPNTYIVTVTDANGCTKTASVTITQPTQINFIIIPANGCFNSTTQLTAIANGGIGSYSYVWNNGTNGNTLNPTQPGIYTATVTDANGCTKTATAQIYSLPNATITGPDLECLGTNTFCTTNYPGASYIWSASNGAVVHPLPNGCMTVSPWGVGGGTLITVTITDANGCTATGTFQVNECCDDPNYTVYNNATLTSGTLTGSSIIINGTMTIATGSNVIFDHCDIKMGQNAKIMIENNAMLEIISSRIYACASMWDGIRTENGSNGVLIIDQSIIEDGMIASLTRFPGRVEITNSTFDHNYDAIHLLEGDFTTSVITGNILKCSSSLKPNPLVAQYSDAHVILEHTTNATIGDITLATTNDFYGNTTDGLRSLWSKNTRIVHNNFYSIKHWGVYAYGKGNITVDNDNYFQSCNLALHTTYFVKTDVHDNRFFRNNIGIGLFDNFDDVDVYNNQIDASNHSAIESYFNSNIHQWYHNNSITIANNAANNKIGILIASANYAPDCKIYNNHIVNHNWGICFSAVQEARAYDNIIETPRCPIAPVPGTTGYAGIYTTGCANIKMASNTITGVWGSYNVNNGYGIWQESSSNNSTWCNTITNCYYGVQYKDMITQLAADGFAGNSMDNCVYQMYLLNVKKGLGTQGTTAKPSDNIWVGAVLYNTFANNANNPGFTDFIVQPGSSFTGAINDKMYPSDGICTFTLTSTPILNFCDGLIANDGDEQKAMHYKEGMEDANADEGQQFEAARSLQSLLKLKPELTDSNIVLQNVKDSLNNTAIGAFAMVHDSLLSLVDSTLNWLENDTVLYTTDSLYNAGTNELKQFNNSISTSIMAEWNRKKLNAIQLNTFAKGKNSFNNAQVNQLRYIANQCERIGGNAVIEARFMLLMVDSVLGEYSNACNGVPLRGIQIKEKDIPPFSFYPNPSNGVVIVKTDDITNSSIIVVDIVGEKVFSENLTSSEEILNLTGLASGSYTMHFARNGIISHLEKLIIIK